MPISIKKNNLLLVEGKDEVYFFEALLMHLRLENVQTIQVGGKDKFKFEFPALMEAEGFSDVTAYAIIRDADNDAKATLDSIQYLLNKYEQPVPDAHSEIKQRDDVKVGIFIMPGDDNPGMLECLCLSTLADDPVLACADKYMDCLKELEEQATPENSCFPKNISKARMHTFLAGQKKYVPSLGMAAKKGYFDLDADAMNELSQFMNELVSC